MTDIYRAYSLGKRLALHKFAEDSDLLVDDLTSALDSLLDVRPGETNSSVLESSERSGSSSWGDKMELETPKNTGLNV